MDIYELLRISQTQHIYYLLENKLLAEPLKLFVNILVPSGIGCTQNYAKLRIAICGDALHETDTSMIYNNACIVYTTGDNLVPYRICDCISWRCST